METRRRFLEKLALTGTAVALHPALSRAAAAAKERDVSPNEDLMREHGALNRILLIYDECRGRIAAKKDFDPEVLNRAASSIKKFIEGYHEKLEEQHVFPRLAKGPLKGLVTLLAAQHAAGRKVTEAVIGLSTDAAFTNESDRAKLSEALASFVRMYRPHEAREDTIVFPAFKATLSENEYDKLGDLFEDRERELLGKDGFEGVVAEIAELEKSLGIYDLAQFTP